MINKRPYILTFIYIAIAMIFPILIWISQQIALPEFIVYNKFYICAFSVCAVSAVYYLFRTNKLKKAKITYTNIWINIISVVVLYLYYLVMIKLLHIKIFISDYNILTYIFSVYLFTLLADVCLCVSYRHIGDEKYQKHTAHQPITDNNFSYIEIGYSKSKIRYFRYFANRVSINKYFKLLSVLNLIVALFLLYCIYPLPQIFR